ncbi:MAG: HAMP domain-containing histidine kinase, partial [Oscillospiraceae bacterium]|nr:HAMP domain-containing histidine kinase [Oscillospiraceae bacterium]
LLEVGGQNLADGKLDEKIKLERLFGGFKKHAEHLNSIGDGMNKAVSDRLKSEMFKTELIANVSHDIRTPLTSIINYTDLLSKLNFTDKKAVEYISVLQRQSARLRKLTEDVLEASKATAGTMKTEKEIMDIKVLLEQLIGEYTERFESKNLMLVSEISKNALIVLADGKLLWRAMDNLFGNICKYAMPQTRVYLNAYNENHKIMITLRNISAVQLNITADALMERFIRGDRSRNTEGSGLGLSIAKSFVELQGGNLTLYVDGDLFKVKIQLPELQEQLPETNNNSKG